MNQYKNFLGNQVSKRILIYLLNNKNKINHKYKITKEIDCTYGSCIQNLNLLKELDLIDIKKKGRKKTIILKEKGKEIAKKLNKIKKLLKNAKK